MVHPNRLMFLCFVIFAYVILLAGLMTRASAQDLPQCVKSHLTGRVVCLPEVRNEQTKHTNAKGETIKINCIKVGYNRSICSVN